MLSDERAMNAMVIFCTPMIDTRFCLSKFGFSAMTYAHIDYMTKFLWGQRRPPEDSEIEQLNNPTKISHSIPDLSTGYELGLDA